VTFSNNSPSPFNKQTIEEREFYSYKENSSDGGTDRRVTDIQAQSILAQILTELGGTAGTPVFDDAFNVSTTGSGTTVQLFSTTVGAGLTRTFVMLNVSSRVGGRFELKQDGGIIGALETGAGNYNASFLFSSLRTAPEGSTITLDFVQLSGPIGAPVSGSLTSTES